MSGRQILWRETRPLNCRWRRRRLKFLLPPPFSSLPSLLLPLASLRPRCSSASASPSLRHPRFFQAEKWGLRDGKVEGESGMRLQSAQGAGGTGCRTCRKCILSSTGITYSTNGHTHTCGSWSYNLAKYRCSFILYIRMVSWPECTVRQQFSHFIFWGILSSIRHFRFVLRWHGFYPSHCEPEFVKSYLVGDFLCAPPFFPTMLLALTLNLISLLPPPLPSPLSPTLPSFYPPRVSNQADRVAAPQAKGGLADKGEGRGKTAGRG